MITISCCSLAKYFLLTQHVAYMKSYSSASLGVNFFVPIVRKLLVNCAFTYDSCLYDNYAFYYVYITHNNTLFVIGLIISFRITFQTLCFSFSLKLQD